MRSLMLLAALLLGAAAVAAPVPAGPTPLYAQAAPGGAAADDDEDEAPATPAKPAPASPTPAPATTTTAPAAPKADAAQAAATEEQMRLVSGAPLFNPNVAVHIVEKKEFSDLRKFELVLYPATIQVNGKWTQHFGTQGAVVYHLNENFGLQIIGGGNWYNEESELNAELASKVSATAQAATALLLTWGVMGGVEVTPIYGKFALFDGTLAHFGIVVSGGAGIGGSRLMLKPPGTNMGQASPATYGDMGLRFLTGIGLGFRLQLTDRFAVRLEVRDTVYTARADRVNGCNLADLVELQKEADAGRALSGAAARVSSGCAWTRFDGVDAAGIKRSNDLTRARNLVRDLSSDVINNVSLFLGASFLF